MKNLLLSTALSFALVETALASGITTNDSNALKKALDGFDKEKVQCYCVFEFDGKSQLAAGARMASIFEEALGPEALAESFHGFIGISSGSLLAAPLALGKPVADVEKVNDSFESKLITPKGLSCCLKCTSKATKMESYYEVKPGEERDEDNYDAIKLDKLSKATIGTLAAGDVSDLKTHLSILSTNNSSDFSEQVISAIDEADKAAKKNAVKVAFKTILEAAEKAVEEGIELGKDGKFGDNIDLSGAQKALEIMSKIDKGVDKVDDILDNTFFKRNLTKTLGNPTEESPVLLIDFRAKTPIDDMTVNTTYKQEISENLVKISYKTKIPYNYYPDKKLSFENVKTLLNNSINSRMLDKDLDSGKSTKVLIDFLKAVKNANFIPLAGPVDISDNLNASIESDNLNTSIEEEDKTE